MVSNATYRLIDLPEHIVSQVLAYLSFSEISECRRVCVYFNRICSRMLNNGFHRVDRFHLQIQRNVKQQLPRRESERRNHTLSRHADILSAVETRLSLLSMTYAKYIELDLCCFIPGKVLDELYRILRLLQHTERQPPRAHEFLQELRDISSMAMEHFEEHVAPALKPRIPPGTMSFPISHTVPSVGSESGPLSRHITSTKQNLRQEKLELLRLLKSSSLDWSNSAPTTPVAKRFPSPRQDMIRMQQQSRAHCTGILALKKEQHEQKSKISEQRRLIAEHERKLQEQAKIISEFTGRIQAQEKNLNLLAQQLGAYTGQRPILLHVHRSKSAKQHTTSSVEITNPSQNVEEKHPTKPISEVSTFLSKKPLKSTCQSSSLDHGFENCCEDAGVHETCSSSPLSAVSISKDILIENVLACKAAMEENKSLKRETSQDKHGRKSTRQNSTEAEMLKETEDKETIMPNKESRGKVRQKRKAGSMQEEKVNVLGKRKRR